MGTVTETRGVGVPHEPGPYDAGSPHSWVRDQIVATEARLGLLTLDMSAVQEARSRLGAHAFDIADAIDRRTEYGQRACQMLIESTRGANPEAGYHERAAREQLNEIRSGLRDAELRALQTEGGTTLATTTGASAVVPPAILLNQLALYRTPYRAVADSCRPENLPDYGMKVSIPNITTPPSVTVQTEGSNVADQDPVMGLITDDVAPFSGQIQVSQQLLDRTGPGIAADVTLFAQLREMLDQQIDEYVIAQILASAQTVTNNGSFALTTASGVGGWVGDLKAARSLVRNTAGVRLNATHCFALGDFTDYVTAYADAQGRPVFSPCLDANRQPIQDRNDNNADGSEGYSGYVVSGLALFADDNLPNYGTTNMLQILVARPSTVHLFEGVPISYLYPPSIAGSLLAILGIRSYATAIPRYPTGAAAITGSAYNAATFD